VQEKRNDEKQRRKAEKAKANETGKSYPFPKLCSFISFCEPTAPTQTILRPLCSVTGPESLPHSDSKASDHGDAAPLQQQEQAAPRKPSAEREDWMTKAMPKAMPEEQEDKDEPAKKVI